MPQDNIADASRPNAGRMYDYYLGGNHNFEVDRQAADQILTRAPYTRKYARLQRWALQDIAVELCQNQNFELIIDFASGLPTEDHIHYHAPNGTTIIYSDFDPITVEYAHDILGDTLKVYYFEANANKPELLLNNPKIKTLLDNSQKTAYVLWGVTTFLSDEEIKHITSYLYEISGPNSTLVFNAQTYNPDNPDVLKAVALYKSMGTQLYPRRIESFNDLIKPWKIKGNKWTPLLEWHGFDESALGQEKMEAFGPMGGGHGAYLIK